MPTNDQLAEDGYLLLPAVFSAAIVDAIACEMMAALARDETGSALRAEDDSIYGARNLMQLWPAVARVWQQTPLPEMLQEALGAEFGLVRVLYFDKPPEQSWALPWHKDMTIAVRHNRLPSEHFVKPTNKGGCSACGAPQWLLENMLTRCDCTWSI